MIEDLQHRLDFILSERIEAIAKARGALMGKLSGNGMLQSSGAIAAKEALLKQQLDAGIIELITDVGRAREQGLSENELRPALDEAVGRLSLSLTETFREKANDAFGPIYGPSAKALQQVGERSASLVRMFWAGYLTRSTPQGITFSLTVHDSPGAAIQQGGQGNSLTVTNSINAEAAMVALTELQAQVAALATRDRAASEASEDLAAIASQLRREKPDTGLVRQLGKSLRAILEGSLAGALSTQGGTAARHLWTALGLG